MPSPFRVLEILLCSLAAFLPYLLLTVYPFRNHLRFGESATACLTALLAALQLTADVLLGLGFNRQPQLISLIAMAVYLVFYVLLFRASVSKILFAFFGHANLSLILTGAAKALSLGLCPEQQGLYHWSHTAILLVLEFLVLIPYAYILVKWLTPILTSRAKAARWTFLWLIPAGLFGLWYAGTFLGNQDMSLSSVPWLRNTLGLLGLNLLAGFLYTYKCRRSGVPAITFFNPAGMQPAAQPEDSQITDKLFDLQCESLRLRVSESDRFHQELLRHLKTMSYHLESGDYKKLQVHFEALQSQISQAAQTPYCDHPAINQILAYFRRQSGYYGIKFSADAELARSIPLSGNDLATLVGNLLDNAVDACSRQKGTSRRIWITLHREGQQLLLSVENTYDTALRQDDQNRYLSTKHSGCGVGLEVCQDIVRRCGGTLDINSANDLFKVNISLPLE